MIDETAFGIKHGDSMTIQTPLIVLFILVFQSLTHAAVLIDDGNQSTQKSLEIREMKRAEAESEDEDSQKSVFNPHSNSIIQMQTEKRVAAGIEFFGKTGLLGVTGDFSFLPFDKATVGFGGGPGYVAIALGYKHLFSDSKLSPYVSGNLARWSSASSTPVTSTSPSYFSQKFLNDTEKQSGHFAHNFVVPAAGLQWTELEKNAAFFGEIMALVDADDYRNVITGAVGAMYFF